MRRVIGNSWFRVVLAAFALLSVLALPIPRPILFEVMNGVGVAIWGVLLWINIPVMWSWLREAPTRGQIAQVGMTLISVGIFLTYVWGYAFRLLARPEWMTDNYLRALIGLVILLGASLLIAVHDVGDEGHYSARGRRQIALTVAVGLCLTVIIVALTGGSP